MTLTLDIVIKGILLMIGLVSLYVIFPDLSEFFLGVVVGAVSTLIIVWVY